MRRLIVCLLGAFVAGLALSAPHSEAQSEHPACAPFRLQWNAVKAGSDLGSMDRIIARIPGVCPALAEQARRERATAASRLADAAKAPLPKAAKAPSVDTETVFFQGARSCADWRSYLGQWPSGRYAALARNRLSEAPCVTPPVIAPAPTRVAAPAPAIEARLGRDFRTLTKEPSDWSAAGTGLCESSGGVIPSGWHVADGERTRQVASLASFGADYLVGTSGTSYLTKTGSRAGGTVGFENRIEINGSRAKPLNCNIAVLLERDGFQSAPIR